MDLEIARQEAATLMREATERSHGEVLPRDYKAVEGAILNAVDSRQSWAATTSADFQELLRVARKLLDEQYLNREKESQILEPGPNVWRHRAGRVCYSETFPGAWWYPWLPEGYDLDQFMFIEADAMTAWELHAIPV